MKFSGKIGFVTTVEIYPGVWEEQPIERQYFGDVTRNLRKIQGNSKVNSDINISNEISIVADPFANENFHNMRFVEFMGAKWKIESVEVQYPRLILFIGGVYNENEVGASGNA